ncbi:MAG: hypothetical protein H6598_07815 [Flavobacteriales bacterium]|nr:hypothetical protein [Flavobacteriales bacterium]
MIRIFNANTPLVLLLLPIVMTGFWLNSLMSDQLYLFENGTFLFNWLWIDYPLINRIIAMILIILTGIQLNAVINNNEFFDKNTYLPALLYVVFMSSSKELHQLHPIIWSNLFWVFAFRRLLNIYNQVQCKSEVFDASVFFVIGAIFNFPFSAVLILFPWITLAIVRPFDLKEYAMPIFALLLGSIYLSFYYYFFDEMNVDIKHNAYFNFEIKENWVNYGLYGFLIILLYSAGFKLIARSNKSSIRFRKITSNLIAFLLLSMLTMLGDKLISNNDAFIFYSTVPMTILFAFLLYHTQKKWIINTIFYLATILMLVNIYFY